LYKFLEQIVSDYMTRDVVTVPPTMSIRELGQRFKETDFNSFPVVDGGQVVGVVNKFDYRACFEFTSARMVPRYDDLMRRSVAGVMTREFIYVGCDTKLTRRSRHDRHRRDGGAAQRHCCHHAGAGNP
jgi:predicted transcriptional regulator